MVLLFGICSDYISYGIVFFGTSINKYVLRQTLCPAHVTFLGYHLAISCLLASFRACSNGYVNSQSTGCKIQGHLGCSAGFQHCTRAGKTYSARESLCNEKRLSKIGGLRIWSGEDVRGIISSHRTGCSSSIWFISNLRCTENLRGITYKQLVFRGC